MVLFSLTLEPVAPVSIIKSNLHESKIRSPQDLIHLVRGKGKDTSKTSSSLLFPTPEKAGLVKSMESFNQPAEKNFSTFVSSPNQFPTGNFVPFGQPENSQSSQSFMSSFSQSAAATGFSPFLKPKILEIDQQKCDTTSQSNPTPSIDIIKAKNLGNIQKEIGSSLINEISSELVVNFIKNELVIKNSVHSYISDLLENTIMNEANVLTTEVWQNNVSKLLASEIFYLVIDFTAFQLFLDEYVDVIWRRRKPFCKYFTCWNNKYCHRQMERRNELERQLRIRRNLQKMPLISPFGGRQKRLRLSDYHSLLSPVSDEPLLVELPKEKINISLFGKQKPNTCIKYCISAPDNNVVTDTWLFEKFTIGGVDDKWKNVCGSSSLLSIDASITSVSYQTSVLSFFSCDNNGVVVFQRVRCNTKMEYSSGMCTQLSNSISPCSGISAAVFQLTLNGNIEDESRRLFGFLSLFPKGSCVPLLITYFSLDEVNDLNSGDEQRNIENVLNLKNYLEIGSIKSFKIVFLGCLTSSASNALNSLNDGIAWIQKEVGDYYCISNILKGSHFY